MMSTDDVQRGDYVSYYVSVDLAGAQGTIQGVGILEKVGDDYFVVRDGDRAIDIPFDKGTVDLRAKQYRLDVGGDGDEAEAAQVEEGVPTDPR